jgi:hypothetical protein
MLFRDSSLGLQEQLQMADFLSDHFNFLARAVDGVEIDLEQFRAVLRPETDRRISIWVNRAHLEMLNAFGKEEEIYAAWDQHLRLCKPNSVCDGGGRC